MAFGNQYFTQGYPQAYPQGMGIPQFTQPQPMPVQPQPPSQPQSSTFVHVQSAAQAREWTVAPNSSVTFIDDNAPYCYTKSMGMSMLEPPVFKKFKLVEEFDEPQQEQMQQTQSPQVDMSAFMTKEDFEPYKAIIEEMQKIAKELNGNG